MRCVDFNVRAGVGTREGVKWAKQRVRGQRKLPGGSVTRVCVALCVCVCVRRVCMAACVCDVGVRGCVCVTRVCV